MLGYVVVRDIFCCQEKRWNEWSGLNNRAYGFKTALNNREMLYTFIRGENFFNVFIEFTVCFY